MVTAMLMIVQQIGAKTARDTFYLSNHPASELPQVMIGAALLSLVGAVSFSALLKRVGPAKAVPATYMLHGCLFLAEWWFLPKAPALVSILLYLHMGALAPVVISGFWSLVNEQFDPHTARKVVSRIAAAAAFGGVLGGLLSERVIAHLDLRSILPILSLVTFVTALLSKRMSHGPLGVSSIQSIRPKPGLGATKYLRDLAGMVLVTSTAAGLLDYVLKAEAAATLPNPEALGSFFALFHAGLSVLVFVVQSSFSGKSLQRLGLGGTIALLPAAVLLGGVLSVAVTRLWTVALVNGLENTLRNSLFRSGYELLYTPVDKSQKRSVKTIIDVAFDRLGDIAAAALALLALWLLPSDSNQLALGFGLGVAALGLLLALRLHRGYVDELANRLRSGSLTADDVSSLDATTQRTLSDTTLAMDREQLLAEIRALQAQRTRTGSDEQSPEAEDSAQWATFEHKKLLDQARTLLVGDVQEVRRFLEAERRNDSFEPALIPFVIRLLGRRHLARVSLAVLQKHGRGHEGVLVDALLDDRHPEIVRRRIPRILRTFGNQRAADGLVLGLSLPDFSLRYHCAQALLRLVSVHAELAPNAEHIFALVSREADVEPEDWKRSLSLQELRSLSSVPPERESRPAAKLEYVFMLLSTVLPAEPLELCLRAIASNDRALRGTALEYLENVLPSRVYAALAKHLLLGLPLRRERRERKPDQIVQDLHQSMSLHRSKVGLSEKNEA